MPSSPSVAVVGATGYAGAEIVELVHAHPKFQLQYITSRSFPDQPFSNIHPRFAGRVEMPCESLDVGRLRDCDLVFFAVPHGTSQTIIPKIRENDLKIVDLGADYRFRSTQHFERVYDENHSDSDGNDLAVYGLTEYFSDEISSSTLVANPGCYATAVLLPLIPIVSDGLVNSIGVIDAKSGISGAGRTPSETNTFVNCNEDIRPYKVASHRHKPEMSQFLGSEFEFVFVPHVIPTDRGIEAALYLDTDDSETAFQAVKKLQDVCDRNSMLRFRGSPEGIKAVTQTPYCDISATTDSSKLVIFSTLDNLRKGAASQALQNANVMFEYEHTAGLL